MPMRPVVRITLAVLAGAGLVGVVVPAALVARDWADEGAAMADLHVRHEVAHPGWSFPAKVQTAPVPIRDTPGRRLVAEAKLRGYRENCKNTGPGEYCGRKEFPRVVPRDGGDALEPIVLGLLIGPDGELREHLPLDQAPKHLVDAILAAEDRAFREHHGVNWSATARAVLANAQEGTYAQGASTLTMQVVRNLAQRREKTLLRKAREMVLSLALDSHLGKDGVLQMYLDAPYLGQWGSLSVCGFQAASRTYFGKNAQDLSVAEAATLAAILPAPGRFAPNSAPERAKERRDRVLQAMAELYGYDVKAALATPVTTVPPPPLPERWPAYLGATRAWLEQQLSPDILYGAGLVVTVAMDAVAQEETERLFPAKTRWFEGLIGKRGQGTMQAAGVLVDTHTGQVRAVYGGADVTATSFNRATQARRQPGSSFKPLTYALAFEQRNPDGTPRYTAASTQTNLPRVFKTPQGDWKPRNVGGEYAPTVSLAQGLAWSQNIATAGLLEEIGGPRPLKDFASRLGFDVSAFPEEMGLALGQAEVTVLEMSQFAATVANGGRKVTASPVLSAIDAAGRQRLGAPTLGEAVITPEAAALTRELMRLVIDVGTGGTSRGAGGDPGYTGQAMGKTGTTDREKDLWFVGASPDLAAAVWLGYDVPQPLGVAASDLAAPLWGWWMHAVTRAEDSLPTFPDTPKMVYRGICRETGKLGNETCHGIRAPFLEGTAPRAACTLEHPPPEPDAEEGAEALDGESTDADATEGEAPAKPRGHESLWKRLAREQEERAKAAEGTAEDGATKDAKADAKATKGDTTKSPAKDTKPAKTDGTTVKAGEKDAKATKPAAPKAGKDPAGGVAGGGKPPAPADKGTKRKPTAP
jgi:penicillin-binding protein 1B